MARAKVRISFESDSNGPSVFEEDIEIGELREPGGQEFTAQHLFSELEKDAGVENHFLALPSVDDFLQPVKQTFHLEDLASGSYEDRVNTKEMWMEIANTLLRAKHLLAQAKAYDDQELVHLRRQHPESENLAWYLHLDKMERFDLAVVLLGKVSDLTARLIFERLGASLISNLDQNDPDWERAITWTKIRKGFADRTGNQYVAALRDAEYTTVQKIFDDFLKTDHGTRLWGYRVRFTHRITPSVDRPELHTHLESRTMTPIVDAAGQTKGWTKDIGGRPTTAQYTFAALYEDAAQTLRHYISMLKRLKAIRRFSPEAGDAASAAGTS